MSKQQGGSGRLLPEILGFFRLSLWGNIVTKDWDTCIGMGSHMKDR